MRYYVPKLIVMKTKSLLSCLMFAICANIHTTNAQVNVQDSLALVDLYNSTDGSHWKQNKNWLTINPVSKWLGIGVRNSTVTYVNLNYNNLNGRLPSSIGSLTNLTTLLLVGNHLSGNIPSSIGNLVRLTSLYLAENRLGGNIPASIGNLVKLDALFLDNNRLSGAIPNSIGNLAKLQFLELYNNQLTGNIPSSIGNLRNLWFLDLGGNQLTGLIPSSFRNLINLQALSLGGNHLKGTIPSFIGNFTHLEYYLSLESNDLTGSIPSSLGNLRALLYLDLHDNRLNGAIPSSLANLGGINDENVGWMDLSQNSFTFDGMQLIAKTFPHHSAYNHQANIPIHQHGNTLSVYAGGTLSNNTYKWFKCDGPGTAPILVATIKGDSVFHPKENGKYRAVVSNSVATQLKLFTKLYDYTVPNNTLVASDKNALHQFGIANAFRVYPNPAKDILRVETNGSATFSLINQSGKILITINIAGKGSINISGIIPGLYYLRNNSTDNVQKVVIAR